MLLDWEFKVNVVRLRVQSKTLNPYHSSLKNRDPSLREKGSFASTSTIYT